MHNLSVADLITTPDIFQIELLYFGRNGYFLIRHRRLFTTILSGNAVKLNIWKGNIFGKNIFAKQNILTEKKIIIYF